MPNRKKDIQKSVLKELYDNGFSCKSIGKILGVNGATICNRLKEFGIKVRMPGGQCWKGKHQSAEHVKKRTSGMKGRSLDISVREKISKSKMGKKLSPETLAKISGKNHHCFGRTKENHPMWKGGISSEESRARHTLEYSNWKRDVLAKSNGICHYCGESKKLETHHIIRFKVLLDANDSRLWDVSNGIAVCEKCHKSLHKEELSEKMIKMNKERGYKNGGKIKKRD